MSSTKYVVVVFAALTLLLSGCAREEESEVLASGLEAPWSITFHGGIPLISERDSGRILVLEEDGTMREIAMIEGVEHAGEGGLLGLATNDDYLYVCSTSAVGNRVERYPIVGDGADLRLGAPEEIISGIPAASFHNGGRIAFGPDGMLYVTTGDAGNRSDAQNLDSLAGKTLRLTPEGDIPGDNPFRDSPIYSYGHRNPQGIAWASDGTMYAAEFGQDTWDELNIIEAGANYGWPDVEGIAGEADVDADNYRDPVQQWTPSEASPSGIAIMGDSIYVANLRGQRLREIPLTDLASSSEYHVGEYGRLRDVVAAPDGSIWVLTSNTDGRGSPKPGDDVVLRISVSASNE